MKETKFSGAPPRRWLRYLLTLTVGLQAIVCIAMMAGWLIFDSMPFAFAFNADYRLIWWGAIIVLSGVSMHVALAGSPKPRLTPCGEKFTFGGALVFLALEVTLEVFFWLHGETALGRLLPGSFGASDRTITFLGSVALIMLWPGLAMLVGASIPQLGLLAVDPAGSETGEQP